MKCYGSKAGCVSLIDKSGTLNFQELASCTHAKPKSTWQEVLAEVDQGVRHENIEYFKLGLPDNFIDTPVHSANCLEDIPLKDEGKLLKFHKLIMLLINCRKIKQLYCSGRHLMGSP
jgi:hypothetical protein